MQFSGSRRPTTKIRAFESGEAQALLDLWRVGDATPSVTDTIADLERVAAI
jgi:hypothetical protein